MVLFSTISVQARDYIHAVGSSTVFPFVTTAAEIVSKKKNIPSPVIESTGTGGGFKLFCDGVGSKYPDIAMASRAIEHSEKEKCDNVGAEVIEFIIGIDGIIVANSKKAKKISLTLHEIYKALGKEIAKSDGSPIKNTNKKWSDINATFNDNAIRVYGPPPSSGTRDAFVSLAMKAGAREEFENIKKTNRTLFNKLYKTMREDGSFIEAGENDTLIVNKLSADPESYGVFGFSFLDLNEDKIQAATINGVEATYENIQDGSYPLSRNLYVYVKKKHLSSTENLAYFMHELLSENASGDDGYLVDKALIPSLEKTREIMRNRLEEAQKN